MLTRGSEATRAETRNQRLSFDPSNRAGVYRIPCECGKVYIGETKRNLPTRLKEHRAHGRRGDFEKSAIVKHSHIKDHQIDWQAAQLITSIATHGTPDASERPSRSSNTTLCHRTSAFSSATFGDQYYRLKDLLYPKSTTHTRLRDRLYPKSTTLLPLCLLTTDSVQ